MRTIISSSIALLMIVIISVISVGIFLIFLITNIVSAIDSDEEVITSFTYCNEAQEVNKERWNDMFEKANTLSVYGDVFLAYAEMYDIDPVLMASISFHETGRGTSNVLNNYNNPAGLMNPDDNWQSPIYYNSLEAGIEGFAKNLHRMINEEGRVTINLLGAVYAPLDAENDPDGLNVNWIPDVTSFTEEFGGLTKHCGEMGSLEIIDGQSWVAPYGYRITSPFSKDRWGEGHNGIDIASDQGSIYGTPAVSFADGVVIDSKLNGTSHHSTDISTSSGWGWYVTILHDGGLMTRYAHLAHKGIPVGTEVRAGEFVGTIGSTGRSSGPHLHFEMIVNDNFIDPMPYVEQFLNGNSQATE